MKRFSFSIIFLFVVSFLNSQTVSQEKSLIDKIEQEDNLFIKATDYFKLLSHYNTENKVEEIVSLEKEMLVFFELKKLPLAKVLKNLEQGWALEKEREYMLAIENYINCVVELERLSAIHPELNILTAWTAILCANRMEEFGYAKNSYKYLLIAKEISSKINDADTQGLIYNSFGGWFFRLKDYRRAIKNFKKALHITEQLNSLDAQEIVASNLAYCYLNLGELDSCMQYLNFIKAIDEKENVKSRKLNRLSLECKILSKKGAYEKAAKLSNQALSLSLELGDIMMTKKIYTHLGQISAKLMEWEKAEKYQKLALEVSLKDSNSDYINNFELAKIAEKQQQYTKATQFYRKSYVKLDSFKQGEAINDFIKLSSEFEIYEIEKSKVALSHQKDMLEMEIHNRNIQLGLAVLGGFLLIGGMMYVQRQKQEIRAAHKVLIEKNRALIKKQTPIKTTVKKVVKEEEFIDELYTNLKKALEIDKVYLDQDITLDKLAGMLNTNRSYLSTIINKKYDKNFKPLINELRINQVLIFFEENMHSQYTIESLSKKAGFKSKSVFNIAFKQLTGLTPTSYIKELNRA